MSKTSQTASPAPLASTIQNAVTNIETTAKALGDLWNKHAASLSHEALDKIRVRLVAITDEINNTLEAVQLSLDPGFTALIEGAATELRKLGKLSIINTPENPEFETGQLPDGTWWAEVKGFRGATGYAPSEELALQVSRALLQEFVDGTFVPDYES